MNKEPIKLFEDHLADIIDGELFLGDLSKEDVIAALERLIKDVRAGLFSDKRAEANRP